MRLVLYTFLFSLMTISIQAQHSYFHNHSFSEADSLRGSLRAERTCYDVHYYGLELDINPARKEIRGYVDMAFKVISPFKRLQIDLYANMKIDRIVWRSKELKYERVHNAVFVDFPSERSKDILDEIRIYYHGEPVQAKNPPWDGGFVWAKDRKGRPWVGVACEGDGASLWWPNKDHLSEEADSTMIAITTPKELWCVANGNLRSEEEKGDKTRYEWFVSYPINNYNVTVNIGTYTHFADEYYSPTGDTLPLDYYVIDYNEKKARTHFKQTNKVLEAFEHYFGPYPFWEDGFALVETPYLGMEHQGAIAYGNRYMRGYMGGMIPSNMDWDYIIVHETGHEYFGNSISMNDHAEMWIHESFTTYMEALYVEYVYGYEDALRYLDMQRFFVADASPILGPLHVNWTKFPDSDHYYKGAMILNTLRHALNDDPLWWSCLKRLHQDNQMSHMTSQEVIDHFNKTTGKNWNKFFQQYLKHPKPPTLVYQLEQQGPNLVVRYRWQADVAGFDMPISIGSKEKMQRVYPSTKDWQEVTLKKTKAADFEVAKRLFYVETSRG